VPSTGIWPAVAPITAGTAREPPGATVAVRAGLGHTVGMAVSSSTPCAISSGSTPGPSAGHQPLLLPRAKIGDRLQRLGKSSLLQIMADRMTFTGEARLTPASRSATCAGAPVGPTKNVAGNVATGRGGQRASWTASTRSAPRSPSPTPISTRCWRTIRFADQDRAAAPGIWSGRSRSPWMPSDCPRATPSHDAFGR